LAEAVASAGLIQSRLVFTGAAWNAVGRILPLLVAVLTTPHLVALLGIERWGVFTLALSLVGIFGVFDLGVGRALTRSVAEHLGAGEAAAAADIAWTGLVLLAALGLLGALGLASVVGQVTRDVLVMPELLRPQVARALYVLCLAVPLAVVNAGLWGVLSACQRFRGANLVNLPVMCGYYVGPWLLLLICDDLSIVMAALVVCRLVMTVAYAQLAVHALPRLHQARFCHSAVSALLRLGGWMTLSNLMQPLLLYLDRFVVASLLSVAATAYYATPYDLATRAWVVPVAIMGAVYPALASAFSAEPTATVRLYQRAFWATLGLLFLPCAAVVVGGFWGLRLWLGAEFAQHAAPVIQWLGVGLLFSCAGFVPAGLIDAIGRPDCNAKWTVAQVGVYVPVLWFTLERYGLAGAAIAWSARAIFECAGRLCLAAWLYKPLRPGLAFMLMAVGAAVIALLGLHALF
jgi:O-antigen/teichoic acid export membrane protein